MERHKEALRKAEAMKAEEARRRAETERQRTTQPNSQRANVRDFGKFTISVAEVGTPLADEDGDYSWEMKTTNGAVSEAYLSNNGSDFMLLMITNRKAAPNDISAMVDSIHKK